MKRLYRTEGPDAKILGVCGGIGEYFAVDPTLVRLIVAALALAGGLSIWVYLIAGLILPKKSDIYPGY